MKENQDNGNNTGLPFSVSLEMRSEVDPNIISKEWKKQTEEALNKIATCPPSVITTVDKTLASLHVHTKHLGKAVKIMFLACQTEKAKFTITRLQKQKKGGEE